jgi:hypothetical protein
VNRRPFERFLDSWAIQRDLDEARDAASDYVREQTVEPVRQLGRYLKFGCLGSIFLSIGGVLVLVGLLRLLQTSSSVFTGHLSWLPYLIIVVLASVALGFTIRGVLGGVAKRRVVGEGAARPARRNLERSVRKVVGSNTGGSDDDPMAGAPAALGLMGVIVAFFWGRRRGRRR